MNDFIIVLEAGRCVRLHTSLGFDDAKDWAEFEYPDVVGFHVHDPEDPADGTDDVVDITDDYAVRMAIGDILAYRFCGGRMDNENDRPKKTRKNGRDKENDNH